MYSCTTRSYLGHTIHIIKALADADHNVQLSVMADKYDTSDPIKLASDFRDSYLESNGWSRIGVINGGIFDAPYANGVEKAFWSANEPNDDPELNGVMAFGHDGSDDNHPVFELQSVIQSTLDSYRGALTGAFGLIKNGEINQGNTSLQGSYGKPSGRSILGVGFDGSIQLIATPGVTGSSGLTGAQCLTLVKDELGLKDAIALDGGGSVSLIYEGTWEVSTTRKVKNTIGLFIKQKSNPGSEGEDNTSTVKRNRDDYIPFFHPVLPHMIMVNGIITKVQDIKIMTHTGLVSIDKMKKGE